MVVLFSSDGFEILHRIFSWYEICLSYHTSNISKYSDFINYNSDYNIGFIWQLFDKVCWSLTGFAVKLSDVSQFSKYTIRLQPKLIMRHLVGNACYTVLGIFIESYQLWHKVFHITHNSICCSVVSSGTRKHNFSVLCCIAVVIELEPTWL